MGSAARRRIHVVFDQLLGEVGDAGDLVQDCAGGYGVIRIETTEMDPTFTLETVTLLDARVVDGEGTMGVNTFIVGLKVGQ